MILVILAQFSESFSTAVFPFKLFYRKKTYLTYFTFLLCHTKYQLLPLT